VTSGGGVLKINEAEKGLPIDATGGYWVWFNPEGGLTELTVTTTASAEFRRYLFA